MAQFIGLASSTAKTAVSCAANGTKGSWVTIGTASADFVGMVFSVSSYNHNNADNVFLDIRTNGSTVAVADLIHKSKPADADAIQEIFIPISGSSSDVIEVRGSTERNTATDVKVSIQLLDTLPFTTPAAGVSYGKGSGVGVQLDPGATPDTESSVVEFTTSGGLTEDADYLIVGLTSDGDNVLSTSSGVILRLYVGAAGGTATGLAVHTRLNTILDVPNIQLHGLFVDPTVFASGTRVWATIQSASGAAGDREMQAMLYTFNLAASGGAGSTFINRGIRSGGAL